jgi:hypothetical protein
MDRTLCHGACRLIQKLWPLHWAAAVLALTAAAGVPPATAAAAAAAAASAAASAAAMAAAVIASASRAVLAAAALAASASRAVLAAAAAALAASFAPRPAGERSCTVVLYAREGHLFETFHDVATNLKSGSFRTARGAIVSTNVCVRGSAIVRHSFRESVQLHVA